VIGLGGLFMLFPIMRWMSNGPDSIRMLTPAVPVAWIAAGWFLTHRWMNFRCPSCDARFFQAVPTSKKFLFRNYYSNHCAECGHDLKKN
jgi:hypothetical protein